MAKREGTYTWYVEPLGSFTNKVISFLGLGADDECGEVRCADGGRHNLWRLPGGYSQIKQLKKSEGDLGLEFCVWVQEGHGQIRLSIIDQKTEGGKQKSPWD